MAKGKATVDKVAVRVYPDTTRFEPEIRRITEKHRECRIDVRLEDGPKVMAALQRMAQNRDTIIRARADVEEAEANLKKLTGSKRIIDLPVRLENARAALLELRRETEKLAQGRTQIEVDVTKARDALKSLKDRRDEIVDSDFNVVRFTVGVENARGHFEDFKKRLADFRSQMASDPILIEAKTDLADARAKLAELKKSPLLTDDTVTVKLKADLDEWKKARAELRSEVKKLRDDPAVLRLKTDRAQLKREIERVRLMLAEVGTPELKASLKLDKEKLEAAKRQLETELNEHNDRIAKELAAHQPALKMVEDSIRQVTQRIKEAGQEATTQAKAAHDAELAAARDTVEAAKKAADERLKYLQATLDQMRTANDTLHNSMRAAEERLAEARKKVLDGHKADVDQLQAEVDRLSKSMKDNLEREQEVKLDTKKAKEELKRLTEDQEIVVEAELEATAARARLAVLTRNRVINLLVNVHTSKAATEIRTFMAGLSGATMLKNWATSFKDLLQHLPQTVFHLAKIAPLIAGIADVAMSALSALAPIGRSLQAIGPGALFAIPAVGGLAASIGVLVMAFKDLDSATGQAAKRFNSVWKDFKTGMAGVKKSVQDAFFSSGFTDAFKTLTTQLLPDLRAGFTDLGGVIGDVMGQATESLRAALYDGPGGNQLAKFFNNLNVGFANAKQGIAGFITGLTNIATKGSEVFPLVGDWVTRMGEKFKDWTENSDIAGMMHEAAIQGGFLIDAMQNLGGIIAGVFHAMDTGSSSGLESFSRTLGRIRDIVKSPGFQTALNTMFQGAQRGAGALKDALGPIGEALESLSGLIGTTFAVLGQVASDALIGIADALKRVDVQEGLHAALVGIAALIEQIPWDSVGQFLGKIGESIGIIGPSIGRMLDTIMPHLPRIMDTVNEILPVLLEIVEAALPPLLDLVDALLPYIEDFAEGAGKAFLSTLEELTPVLEALATTLEVLYPLFDKLNIIVAVSESLFRTFLAPLQLLTLSFSLGGGAAEGFGGSMDDAGGRVEKFVGVSLKDLADGLDETKRKFSETEEVLVKSFERVGHTSGSFGDDLDRAGGHISEFAEKQLGRLRSSLDETSNKFQETEGKANRSFTGGMNRLFENIREAPGAITSALGDVGNMLWGAGRKIIDGLWGGMKSVWETVTGWVRGLGPWIADHKGPLEYDRQLLMPAGQAIMGGFHDSLKSGFDGVEDLVSSFGPQLSTDFSFNGTAEAGGGLAGLWLAVEGIREAVTATPDIAADRIARALVGLIAPEMDSRLGGARQLTARGLA
jgi:phage-related protein